MGFLKGGCTNNQNTKSNGGSSIETIELVDNLNSTSTTSALTANQGRVLNERINSIVISNNPTQPSSPEAQTKVNNFTQKAEMIAHRGLNSAAVEGSELAYIKAYENNIKSWECDVQNTSDGELVIVHDQNLIRTSNDSRVVTNLTYAQISVIDNSKLFPYYSPTYIITFDKFIKMAKSYPEVVIYPEISPYQNSAAKIKTVETIVNNGMEDRAVIQSFNFNDFSVVRQRSSKIKLGYLCSNLTTFESALALAEADGNADILIDYQIVLANPSIVSRCIQKRVGLAVWTVNDFNVYKQLNAIGVSRIMTDSLIGGFI